MTPKEKKISKTALLLIGISTAISLLLSLLDVIKFNTALKTISIAFITIGIVAILINEVLKLKDSSKE